NNSSTSAGGGHWSLLAYKKGGTFYYYDSMGSSNLSSAQTLANNFLKCLKISGEAKLNQTSCPQQPNEERNRLIKAGFPKKSSGSPDASEDNVSDEDTIYFESEEDRISHCADNFKEFSKKVRKLSARTKTQLGGENLKKILRIKRILKICSDPAGDFGGKVNEEYVRESIKQEIVNEINKLYTT
ncbi:2002_t:CDS:2, partial [Paraglomus brasilianum]